MGRQHQEREFGNKCNSHIFSFTVVDINFTNSAFRLLSNADPFIKLFRIR